MTYEERIQRALAEAEQAEKAAKEAREKAEALKKQAQEMKTDYRIERAVANAKATILTTPDMKGKPRDHETFEDTLCNNDWIPYEMEDAAAKAYREEDPRAIAKAMVQATTMLAAYWTIIEDTLRLHEEDKKYEATANTCAYRVLEPLLDSEQHENTARAIQYEADRILEKLKQEVEASEEAYRKQRREQFPEEFED